MKKTLATGVLAITMSSCGSNYEISASPMTGTVNGSSWALSSGITDSVFSDAENYSVTLYGLDRPGDVP